MSVVAITSDLNVQRITTMLHLSSPALPIGGFSYSQGLEAAVELGLVHDEPSTLDWIAQQLFIVQARSEGPLWYLLFQAWKNNNISQVTEWNQWFYASRETQELRQETEQMGRSLYKLALELEWANSVQQQTLTSLSPMTLPCVHALICVNEQLSYEAALTAYLFTWLENQVTAAIKSVPLGQLAGQRILTQVIRRIPEALTEALDRAKATPPKINAFAPQYAIIASRHETQFSRLFRS